MYEADRATVEEEGRRIDNLSFHAMYYEADRSLRLPAIAVDSPFRGRTFRGRKRRFVELQLLGSGVLEG